MILIEKSRQPNWLTEHQRRGGTFEGLSGTTSTGVNRKQDLRELLVKDQHGLCAYCTQRIRPTPGEMKIEHYYPQALIATAGKGLSDRRYTAYKNLLGCCYGGQALGKPNFHCDNDRPERELTLDPQREAHIIQLRYNFADGTIKSDNPTLADNLNVDLRLNVRYLKIERKRRLLAFQKQLREYGGSKRVPKSYYERALSDTPKPHEGIRRAYIQKKLNSLA